MDCTVRQLHPEAVQEPDCGMAEGVPAAEAGVRGAGEGPVFRGDIQRRSLLTSFPSTGSGAAGAGADDVSGQRRCVECAVRGGCTAAGIGIGGRDVHLLHGWLSVLHRPRVYDAHPLSKESLRECGGGRQSGHAEDHLRLREPLLRRQDPGSEAGDGEGPAAVVRGDPREEYGQRRLLPRGEDGEESRGLRVHG